jgi:hypothetical protein
MKKIAGLLTVLVLVGCGTQAKDVRKPGVVRGGNGQVNDCKARSAVNAHEVTLKFSAELPAKLAVTVGAETKVNECTPPIVVVPPLVSIQRFSGTTLLVYVEHQGAYPELPREVSFRITDLKDCKANSAVLADVQNVPLTFVQEFPNGPSCPSRFVARTTVQVGK